MLTAALTIAAGMSLIPLADGHNNPDDGSSSVGQFASSEYKYSGYLHGQAMPISDHNMGNTPTRMTNDYNLHAIVQATGAYGHGDRIGEPGECTCESEEFSSGSSSAPEECDCPSSCGCEAPEEETEPIDPLEALRQRIEALRQEIEKCRQEIEEVREEIANAPEDDLEDLEDQKELLEDWLKGLEQSLKGKELELQMETRRRQLGLPTNPDPPPGPTYECACGCLDCSCTSTYIWPTWSWTRSMSYVYFTYGGTNWPTHTCDRTVSMEVAAEAWALSSHDVAEFARQETSGDSEHPLTHDARMKSWRKDYTDENGMSAWKWAFSDSVCLRASADASSELVQEISVHEPVPVAPPEPHNQGGRALATADNIPDVSSLKAECIMLSNDATTLPLTGPDPPADGGEEMNGI